MPTQWTPSARELDDLELILTGALDETLTLRLPLGGAGSADDPDLLELTDPEGVPLAELAIDHRDGDLVHGSVTGLAHPQFGAFRRYHLSPARVRAQHAGTPTFAVAVSAPLTTDAVDTINAASQSEQATPLLLVLVGTGSPEGVSAPALVRATLAAAEDIKGAEVVTVPVARRDSEQETAELRDRVALAFSDEV
ncbi:MAG: hypothetical protein ACRDOJ_00745, partial [Nocardioidaceae bacterium]